MLMTTVKYSTLKSRACQTCMPYNVHGVRKLQSLGYHLALFA